MKNKWYLVFGLILFAAFFISSVIWESPLLLYIASAIPIFIVPFLPDLKTRQKLKIGQRDVEIVKLADASGQPEWLIVSFKPGTVIWSRNMLIIPFKDAPVVETVNTGEYTASITVLSYDLQLRKSKPGQVGVVLPNLAARLTSMPITVYEVNRLVIPLTDLAGSLTGSSASSVPAARNVELQA